MQKIIIAFALLITYGLSSCHSSSTGNNDTENIIPVSKTAPNTSLAMAMDTAMAAYYQLKEAIARADTADANNAVIILQTALDSVPLTQIKNDSVATFAKATIGSISGEILGLQGETDILEKRREFSMISDMLYDLIKSVGLKNQTVYRDFCPMAFDSKGAYWLSNEKKINNPYYGRVMPDCGEVKETMKF